MFFIILLTFIVVFEFVYFKTQIDKIKKGGQPTTYTPPQVDLEEKSTRSTFSIMYGHP